MSEVEDERKGFESGGVDYITKPVSPQQAIDVLKKVQDVVVRERQQDFPTPVEATGKDPVYVGRIRRDTSNPECGLNLWIVADNLRIGAALNAVRLAEVVVKNNWLKTAKQRETVSV